MHEQRRWLLWIGCAIAAGTAVLVYPDLIPREIQTALAGGIVAWLVFDVLFKPLHDRLSEIGQQLKDVRDAIRDITPSRKPAPSEASVWDRPSRDDIDLEQLERRISGRSGLPKKQQQSPE